MNLHSLRRLCAIASVSLVTSVYGQLSPGNLSVEHLKRNVLVDVPESSCANPRLSWINRAAFGAKGEVQKAYRICVATSPEALLSEKPDVWDSKKVKSADSYLVRAGMPALAEGTSYYWRVKVWNGKGKESEWSPMHTFTTGLKPGSWKAQWIGAPWQGEEPQFDMKTSRCIETFPPVPYLRKGFSVKRGIRSAKAFVTGLGHFELFVNGSKVGDDLLVPNFTNYTSRPDLKYRRGISLDEQSSGFRVAYLHYDITSMLCTGNNAVGAMIASGYYDTRVDRLGAFGSPRFLCQIEITYDDGSRQTIVSDPTWKAHESGITSCDIYAGENYDAQKEITGWCNADFDDSGWQNAIPRKAPDGKLVAFDTNPDRVTQVIKPQAYQRNDDGSYTIDFGEMISGHVRIKGLAAEKGKVMKIRYESVYPQEVNYTFKDDAPVEYAPQFTWYVFRKVTVSGVMPKADQITAEAVNTDMEVNGAFSSSNELFNVINHIWQRTEKDNVHCGVESDCPHRERIPYTGDGQAVCSTVMHNFDAAAFFKSWFNTMRDTQDKVTGYEPNAAPWCPGAGGGVAWGAAMVLMPWEHYLNYGDREVLEENYDAAARHMKYMTTWVGENGVMHQKRKNALDNSDCYWLNLGDWVPPYGFPADEKVHTYMLWRCADRMCKMAKVLGKTDDAKRYSELAENTKEAYDKAFYANDNDGYGDYGCNAFAAEMGLDAKRPGLAAILANEISVKHQGHLNGGYLALEVLFENLARMGNANVAYNAMNKTDFPSFGKMVADGATTMWEQFDGQNSENHPFLGCALTWLYRKLAGVNTDPEAPAYRHLIVRPVLADSLLNATYSKESPYGKVYSNVTNMMQQVNVAVEVPVGSTATVYVPAPNSGSIKVNGSAKPTKGVKSIEKTSEGYTVELLQGSHTIVADKK